MGLLQILGGEKIKEQIFKKMADAATAAGTKRRLIIIPDEGSEFQTETIDDDKIIVDKKEYDYLKNFFTENINK